jgi:hypothetical protein
VPQQASSSGKLPVTYILSPARFRLGPSEFVPAGPLNAGAQSFHNFLCICSSAIFTKLTLINYWTQGTLKRIHIPKCKTFENLDPLQYFLITVITMNRLPIHNAIEYCEKKIIRNSIHTSCFFSYRTERESSRLTERATAIIRLILNIQMRGTYKISRRR